MTRAKLSDRIDDERAVSPVIGVILMVAITVILAAVIGTFVLDLGQSAGQSAPQASLSVTADAGNDQVTIEHSGGDALTDSDTRIIIETPAASTTVDSATNSGELWTGTLTVGNSVVIGDGTVTLTINPGDQVEVTIIDTASQRQVFQTTVTA